MRKLLFIPLIFLILCQQGCSWICGFYIANTTNEVISVEMKLVDSPGNFPIFQYPFNGKMRQFRLKTNKQVNYERASDVPADTLGKYSHYVFRIQPHSAVEIGQLQNDTYKQHDQYFINGRKFNLEKLIILEKNIEINASTFDNYFRKGKNGGVYFVL